MKLDPQTWLLLRQVLPGVAAATSGGNVETGDAVSPALHLAVGTRTSGHLLEAPVVFVTNGSAYF